MSYFLPRFSTVYRSLYLEHLAQMTALRLRCHELGMLLGGNLEIAVNIFALAKSMSNSYLRDA